jgi:hyperosmotically inducible protein
MSGKAWMRSLVAVGAMFGAAAPALAQTPPPPVSAAVLAAEAEPQPQVVTADDAITTTIKAKLADNKILRSSQVTIASTNGVVTLVGTVASPFARDQVLEAARSTPGVVRIDDQLRFDISSPSAPARSN